jgi:hypothetical protein
MNQYFTINPDFHRFTPFKYLKGLFLFASKTTLLSISSSKTPLEFRPGFEFIFRQSKAIHRHPSAGPVENLFHPGMSSGAPG